MSKIHYFQRYQEKENVVTNNTLLLFSRLYNNSINKFKVFLNTLFESSNIPAGIDLFQQERLHNAIPDGIISQKSFKILIETKKGNNFEISQLINHLKHFKNEDEKILVALGNKLPNESINYQIQNEIAQYNKLNNSNIQFYSTTFDFIIEAFRNTINDFDFELVEIIDDYADFCENEGLLPKEDFLLRLVLAGKNLKENFEQNIYYDNRGFREHQFIGLYSNKSIIAIGKIEGIFNVEIENNNLNVLKTFKGEITENQKNRIIETSKLAMETKGWDITKNTTFFCVEKFFPTNFKKITPYAPMGTKFFNLKEYLKEYLNDIDFKDTELIAKKLELINWK